MGGEKHRVAQRPIGDQIQKKKRGHGPAGAAAALGGYSRCGVRARKLAAGEAKRPAAANHVLLSFELIRGEIHSLSGQPLEGLFQTQALNARPEVGKFAPGDVEQCEIRVAGIIVDPRAGHLKKIRLAPIQGPPDLLPRPFQSDTPAEKVRQIPGEPVNPREILLGL